MALVFELVFFSIAIFLLDAFLEENLSFKELYKEFLIIFSFTIVFIFIWTFILWWFFFYNDYYLMVSYIIGVFFITLFYALVFTLLEIYRKKKGKAK